LTPFSRREFEISYERAADAVEQARRTIVRSFLGFGSNAHNRKTGFRANSNRSGTTPARDWRNYPAVLEAFTDRLLGVVIEGRDALKVIQQHDGPDTLHYVDPPYVHATRDPGTDYSHEMTDEDHASLADVLHGVAGMVVLSGYDCDLYRELYRDWAKIERRALADGARERVEIVWLNAKAESGQSQTRLFR
jgi:DNA adenine methylase